MKMLSREDILKGLSGRSHCHYYECYGLAWYIKMLHADHDGRSYAGDLIPVGTKDGEVIYNDSAYDSLWEAYLDANPDLFWEVCEDMLAGVVGLQDDKPYEFFEGHGDKSLASVRYEMHTFGRSGGWLGLFQFGEYEIGGNVSADDFDYILMHEMPHKTLWVLYKFVCEIDQLVSERYLHYARELAWRRHEKEVEWRQQGLENQERLAGQVGPVLLEV